MNAICGPLLNLSATTGDERRDEDLGRTDLAAPRIDHRHRVAAVVDEHLLAGAVHLAHRTGQRAPIGVIARAELAVSICRLTVRRRVLLPQKLQGHALALELLVDQRIVGRRIPSPRCRLDVQQRLQPTVIQVRRQRPAQAFLQRPPHRVRHRAFRQPRRRRDLLVAQSRLKLEAQNIFDLAHGTPSRWHRLPRSKIRELSQQHVSSSAIPASFRANVTTNSGNVTDDSGQRPKIGHLQSESAVTFGRNDRSRSIGISGQIRPEYAPRPEADSGSDSLSSMQQKPVVNVITRVDANPSWMLHIFVDSEP
jgi:hypothetical protein